MSKYSEGFERQFKTVGKLKEDSKHLEVIRQNEYEKELKRERKEEKKDKDKLWIHKEPKWGLNVKL